MRKFTLLLCILGLVLFITPLSAQPPQGTTVLTFDGFCDGATINVSGDFIGGTHDNWDCAGSQAPVGGTVETIARVKPASFKGTIEAALTDDVGQVAFASCPLNLYLSFNPNKWAYYMSCDGVSPQTLLNSGTFTISGGQAKANHRGGVSSFQGKAGAVDDSDLITAIGGGYPKGPYTAAFDGFCDFMVVNTKGNNIGGTHDLLTNCGLFDAHVSGNNEQQPADVTGTAGAGALMASDQNFYFGFPNCVDQYYLTFSNHTWALYRACDASGPFFVNAGTFTLTTGTPPPVKGTRPTAARH
ncbi:MAG: hypothetical protein C5B51_26775 [Terriglobia bacterium]|nr:MAG: hypothetical protein C5B51_26775 [Terriglobia bacterium]